MATRNMTATAMSLADIRGLLGYTKTELNKARKRADFPRPYQRTNNRHPVFHRSEVLAWAKQHWSPSLADQVRRSAYTHEYDSAVKSVAARLARENPDRDPTEITLLAHRGAALLVNELATARHAALRPQALVF